MAQQAKSFSDIITLTRSSAGSRFNSAGVLEMVAANQPRFDFDPITLQPRGLLVEEQRTNLLTYSSDFSQAAWGKNDTTVSYDGTLAPDGTQLSILTQGSAGTGYINRLGSSTVTAGAVTASMFMKRGNHDWVRLSVTNNPGGTNAGHAWFNLATGTKGQTLLSGNATNVTSRITHFGNGLYRCEVSAVLSDTTANIVSLGVAGDGTSFRVAGYRYCWLGQLEQGSFASSPIPTTDTQVTRAADVVSIGSLTPWFNPTAGTLFAEFGPLGIVGATPLHRHVLTINDNSANNYLCLRLQSSGEVRGISVAANTTQANLLLMGSPAQGSTIKAAMAYKSNDFVGVANGGAVASSSNGSLPTVNRVGVGQLQGVSQPLNGHIRRIRYWPNRIANSDLQVITA